MNVDPNPRIAQAILDAATCVLTWQVGRTLYGRAAVMYGRALESFTNQIERVDASIGSIREERFLKAPRFWESNAVWINFDDAVHLLQSAGFTVANMAPEEGRFGDWWSVSGRHDPGDHRSRGLQGPEGDGEDKDKHSVENSR